jgi:hypothetical protein
MMIVFITLISIVTNAVGSDNGKIVTVVIILVVTACVTADSSVGIK